MTRIGRRDERKRASHRFAAMFAGAAVLRNHRGRFGDTIEYIAPDGRGVVIGSDGKFLFFREGGL